MRSSMLESHRCSKHENSTVTLALHCRTAPHTSTRKAFRWWGSSCMLVVPRDGGRSGSTGHRGRGGKAASGEVEAVLDEVVGPWPNRTALGCDVEHSAACVCFFTKIQYNYMFIYSCTIMHVLIMNMFERRDRTKSMVPLHCHTARSTVASAACVKGTCLERRERT